MSQHLQAAVLGFPIAHSLSPRIHTQWIAQFGLKGTYVARAVEPNLAALSTVLTELKAEGYNGCNLTVPLKELVLQLPSYSPSHRAAWIGAANTVSFFARDNLENTDLFGVEYSLRAMGATVAPGCRVLILGAGGAARAAAAWAHAAGAKLILANRSTARAAALCSSMGVSAEILALDDTPSLQRAYAQSSIVIQTTSAELDARAELAPLLPTCDLSGVFCLDMVYRRDPVDSHRRATSTQWSMAAAARGATAQDGLSMLVAQAAQAFQIWTGLQPDIAATLTWLRASLSH